MIRRTSIDTFHRIESEGLLSKRRFEVYATLFNHGPLTSNGVFSIMRTEGHHYVGERGFNIAARLGELRDMGVAYEVGETVCSITGNTVIEWDVTEELPRKLDKSPKEPTKAELIRHLSHLVSRAQFGTKQPGQQPQRWVGWNADADRLQALCAKYQKVQK